MKKIILNFKSINKLKMKLGLIPFVIAILIVFIVSINIFINITSDALKADNFANTTYTIDNLEFSFDQNTWESYNNFLEVNKYDKKEEYYIKGNFPTTTINSPVISIYTKNNYASLSVDGEIWGTNLKNLSNRSTGTVYNIFTLRPGYEGKEFILTLQTNNISNAGLINSIYVKERLYVYLEFLYSGLILTIFSIFSILVGFIITLTFASERYRNNGFYFIGIFSILIGLFWYANVNIFSSAFFNNKYASTLFSYFIIYLLPLPFIKYIKNFDRINASLYDNLFFYYLIALIIILCGDIFNIIYLEDWLLYVFTFFVIIILLSLYIYSFKLFNDDNSKINSKTNLQKFALPFFILEVMSVAYDIYIIFNATNIISKNQVTPFIHTIFLIISVFYFSKDLKTFNDSFVLNSEKIKLNKICINKIVTCQDRLFTNLSYDNLKENYIPTVTDFLFPKKNQHMIPVKKLISSVTYDNFYKNYNDFLLYSSSYIYMTKPESMFSTKDEQAVIISASGIYKPFIDTDPYKTMNSNMLRKFNANLASSNTITDESIILRIGNSDIQHGVMVFENIGYLSDNQIALLESYMSTLAILLENDFLLNIAKRSHANTVYKLNEFSELRSKETGNHIRRVALYCKLLGSKYGLSENDLETLHLASSMHDIGKINIPDEILNKPGKLTEKEFAIMRTHSHQGYKILCNIRNPIMEAGSIVAYYHHERFDGTGLYKLKGEEIPIFARIVAIADVFDALLSQRVYKEAWHLQAVLDLFEEERNKQFDGKLVDLLFENIDGLLEIKNTFSDNL